MAKDEWSPLENQVAEASIRRRARQSAVGRSAIKFCPASCFTRKGVSNCYFRTGFITATFLIMLIAFFIWLVLPYIRSTHFKSTTCSVVSTDENTASISCKCGTGCYGQYPCLKVRVSYNKQGQGYATALLHATEYKDPYECTFTPPCRRDYGTNQRAVRAFSSRHRSPFRCLYDPRSDYVMASRRLAPHLAVHLLLWPALAASAAAAGLGAACAVCGRRYCCETNKPPADVALLAAGLRNLDKDHLDDVDADPDLEMLVRESAV